MNRTIFVCAERWSWPGEINIHLLIRNRSSIIIFSSFNSIQLELFSVLISSFASTPASLSHWYVYNSLFVRRVRLPFVPVRGTIVLWECRQKRRKIEPVTRSIKCGFVCWCLVQFFSIFLVGNLLDFYGGEEIDLKSWGNQKRRLIVYISVQIAYLNELTWSYSFISNPFGS